MAKGYRIDEQTGKRIASLLNQTQFRGSDRGGNLHAETNILVRNKFTEAIPRYSVLQPVDVFWLQDSVPVIDVTQYDGTYEGEFLFSSSHPIEVDAIGMAQSDRVVRCFFADGDGSIGTGYKPKADSWDLEIGGDYVMACGETGNAGEMMAVIRGIGSGDIVAVTVSQVGGSNGTATTAPTWTYDVTYRGGVILAAASPEWARVHGHHVAATKGTARHDATGWVLYQVDEVPSIDVFECEP